jgi:hypothetical protein
MIECIHHTEMRSEVHQNERRCCSIHLWCCTSMSAGCVHVVFMWACVSHMPQRRHSLVVTRDTYSSPLPCMMYWSRSRITASLDGHSRRTWKRYFCGVHEGCHEVWTSGQDSVGLRLLDQPCKLQSLPDSMSTQVSCVSGEL